MKKFLYKLLPLILIFVFIFSFSVSAGTAEDEHPYLVPLREMTSAESACYTACLNAVQGQYNLEEYKYIVAVSENCEGFTGVQVYLSNTPMYASRYGDTDYILRTMSNGYPIRYRGTISNGSFNGYYSSMEPYVSSTSAGYNYTPIVATYDVYIYGDLYLFLDGTEDNPVEEEPPADNDFFFGAFEDFADFGEESAEHYNNAMNQTVTENSNNPNDSVFQKLLQAMVGSLTTNNSISQQISNQLQHFTEQFFNNFAQYSLGLMNDILNTLNEFTGKFDSLLEITGQLYESGLDSNGNFDVGTMLSYWFVPDVDGIKRSYDNTIGQINTFDVVTDTMLGFLSSIQEVEPVAPIFTIPAGTYGLLTIKEDILIKFDWFESWKPYTDPLIAAFIYVTFFWHLFKQLPGIISGSAATTATVGHFNDAAIKDANRKAKGG